jgi:cyanate permease
VGNLAGFVGPYVVGLLKDATGGFGAAMGALALFLVLAAIIAVRQPRAPFDYVSSTGTT